MVWIIGLWSVNHLPPIAFGVFSGNDGPAIKCDRTIYTTANCYFVAKLRHLFRFREVKTVNGEFHFPTRFEKCMTGNYPIFSSACLSF